MYVPLSPRIVTDSRRIRTTKPLEGSEPEWNDWKTTNIFEATDLLTNAEQAIGAAPDAVRMKRVVNFYEKLPRGPAPEVKPSGLFGAYQAKHFGKNPTGKRTSHTRS